MAIRLNGGANIGAPDHLVGARLDFFSLEEILTLLVAGKVDYAIPFIPHRLGDREQHSIAKAASRQQHILGMSDLTWRAGWSHNHDRFSGSQAFHQPRRDTQFQ